MNQIIAWREKLLALGLVVVLVATVLVTRSQHQRDRHRSLGALPAAPREAELERTFPFATVDPVALQRSEPFESLKPLVEQDPFARVQTAGAAAPSAAPPPPAASLYLYRGRILMGGKQLAIIESVASKDTVFVAVGQELDGLKVVDIAEERVVLSKPPDQQVILRPAEAAARQENRGARGSQ